MGNCRIVPLDIIRARGHRNVRATHRTTIEVTRDDFLTERGDCIIGIMSSAGLSGLRDGAKEFIRKGKEIVVLFMAGGAVDSVHCRGDERLPLSSERKMIIRRSSYIDESTLCIEADKSASSLSRELISKLSSGEELLVILLGLDEGQ
ncbi:MAG: DUF371 domain-containing protein [Fervidicoccaceae archaeon]